MKLRYSDINTKTILFESGCGDLHYYASIR